MKLKQAYQTTIKTSHNISKATQGKNIIVFDGICVLCNAWIKFALRFDCQKRLHFVIAQSELGAEIYATLGLMSDDYDSFVVITNGEVHTKLDGVFALLATLGYPWDILSVGRILPPR